jgi:hypothetical protein
MVYNSFSISRTQLYHFPIILCPWRLVNDMELGKVVTMVANVLALVWTLRNFTSDFWGSKGLVFTVSLYGFLHKILHLKFCQFKA